MEVIISSLSIHCAAIQFHAEAGDIEGNLFRVERLVEQAASQGAQLILLPELTPGGYLLTPEIWDSAETKNGKSVHWLKATAKRQGVYLGMSYLEAEGANFYNSFVLATPKGDIAGRVRKNPPASAEAYFYRAGEDVHYIDTEMGRIGVCICYEALLYQYLLEHHQNKVDLLLIPMSAGTPAPKFPMRKKDTVVYDELLRGLAVHHARALGIPVVMANKCGPLVTPMPFGMPFQDTVFPGLSTIANAHGEVLSQLQANEGIALAEIELDASLKTKKVPRSYGRWALPVPWFSFMFPLVAFLGSFHYSWNKERAARANALVHPDFDG